MGIAIPITGDCLGQHFGHCQRFAFVDIDPERRKIVSTTEIEAPEHLAFCPRGSRSSM